MGLQWAGMGYAPTWLRQVSPLLHKTTLTTAEEVIRTHVVDSFHADDGFFVSSEVRWRLVTVQKKRAGSAVRAASNNHLTHHL